MALRSIAWQCPWQCSGCFVRLGTALAPAPSAVALGDFADPATAAAEVVKACDAKRKGKAKAACVVVLEVGPAG
jgi:hypothetical protein